MSGAPLRLLLADDHAVVLEGLAALLGAMGGFEIVGKASDAAEAVALHARLRPDVAILDLRMGGTHGIDAIRDIRRTAPHARILVLTTFDTEEEVFGALQAGAAGYLLKSASPQALAAAIRDVAAGLRALPPAVAARLAERVAASDLTPRELEVLAGAARGERNRDIARRLGVTVGTVKGHLYNVFDKLGVKSRTQAVVEALARGLVSGADTPPRRLP